MTTTTQEPMHQGPWADSAGVRLWRKAKGLIPGGNQLLSKRAERFLPGLWPAYYERAKGCEVWDLDGRRYYDFAQMGVGSCVLGYADDDVNAAVSRAIERGSMSTLNCPEEVELAERLVALHPWAEMVRFGRTGGEACAIAIRIARAATGRGGVAFCGYHGWHDWYLSSNLEDPSNLDRQLLSGLPPRGVPAGLRNTAFPFHYNDADSLEKILALRGSDIGTIIMEPERGSPPAGGFLQRVRSLASEHGAVLIFDEVTSGFRMNVGGIHRLLGVDPDLAVVGKGLGNGFPISAVIGRRAIMDAAQGTFISSTFWTERCGFAAALATLEKMERCHVPARLIETGELIIAGLKRTAANCGVGLQITGIPPLIYLSFQVEDPLGAQTYWTQEMLRRGFLAGSAIYTTWAYTAEIIGAFIEASAQVLPLMAERARANDFRRHLAGEVAHTGFQRLT